MWTAPVMSMSPTLDSTHSHPMPSLALWFWLIIIHTCWDLEVAFLWAWKCVESRWLAGNPPFQVTTGNWEQWTLSTQTEDAWKNMTDASQHSLEMHGAHKNSKLWWQTVCTYSCTVMFPVWQLQLYPNVLGLHADQELLQQCSWSAAGSLGSFLLS